MTIRAWILGMVGVAVICSYTYVNDALLNQTYLVGNSMPLAVYGTLVLLILLVNPMLGKIHARLPLNGRELAFILVITLAACVIPSSGLLRTFTGSLVVPHRFNKLQPGWMENQVLQMVPDAMLVQPGDAAEPPLLHQVDALTVKAGMDGHLIIALADEKPFRILRDDTGAYQLDEPATFGSVNIATDDNGALLLTTGEGISARVPVIAPPEYQQRLDAAIAQATDRVVTGFSQGLAPADGHISLAEVPWRAWLPTLRFWIPLLLVLWFGLLGLSVILHRQWSDHEQLPYPIAQFAGFLLPAEREHRSGIIANPLFWFGLLAILIFHGNNYLFTWFPRIFILTPRDFDLSPLRELVPTFMAGNGWWGMRPTVYFTVLAFAYFLSSDVSFSMGFGPYLFTFITGYFLLNYGISLSGGGYLTPKPQTFLNFGSYLGLFLVLLYTGRHYYLQTFKQALCLPSPEKIAPSSLWGARILILSGLCFVVMLGAVGFDWQLAFLYWLFMVMIFAVMGRIIAETGLFLIQPTTFPCVMLLGMFGAHALGPGAVAVMFMMTAVFLIDPREALMPFLINNLKIVDLRSLKVGRSMVGFAAALVLGLAIAMPVTLYFQYDRGANLNDAWAYDHVPKMPFDEALKIKQRLDAQEKLESSQALAGFERFAEFSPDRGAVISVLAGLALVVLFSFCRLRFAWWPLHPVLFLIWSSGPGKWFAFSFMCGWVVKLLVSKYGGAKIYQQLKPLMIGIIAGDMLGGVLPSLIGIVYYLVTGQIPESYRVMPG